MKSLFSYSDEKLSGSPINVSDWAPSNGSVKSYDTRIEKIVVVGLEREPFAVKMADGQDLVFVTRKSGTHYIVTIKNPNMLVGSAFSISIK